MYKVCKIVRERQSECGKNREPSMNGVKKKKSKKFISIVITVIFPEKID